jgi:hypothetical protein
MMVQIADAGGVRSFDRLRMTGKPGHPTASWLQACRLGLYWFNRKYKCPDRSAKEHTSFRKN